MAEYTIMKNVCKCGMEFLRECDLRAHIAVVTPKWPRERCTAEHHNPKDFRDVGFVLGGQASLVEFTSNQKIRRY